MLTQYYTDCCQKPESRAAVSVKSSYIYNKKTAGSDTWWLQTSPQRSLRRWVSGAPRTSPYTSARQCRDLHKKQTNVIFLSKMCWREAALERLSSHLPGWDRSLWTPRSHMSPRSPLSSPCIVQSTAWWPAPCFGRCCWSLRCCKASRSSGKHSGQQRD